MAFTVKAYWRRTEAEDRMRFFPLELDTEGSNEGVFDSFNGALLENFLGLESTEYFIKWEDVNGDHKKVSNDKQLTSAASHAAEHTGNVITVNVWESGTDNKKKRIQWMKGLREAVPKTQRKWARAYICQWRKDNLEGTLSSESGEEDAGEDKGAKLDREKHQIPEDYELWLVAMLPRWHKNWGGEVHVKPSPGPKDGEKGNPKSYAESVPIEFRKWVRSYLARQFGNRPRPKLKGEKKPECHKEDAKDAEVTGAGEKTEKPAKDAEVTVDKEKDQAIGGDTDKKEKPAKDAEVTVDKEKDQASGGDTDKKEKKPVQFKTLAEKVPKGQRRWAKAYINEWRKENLEDVSDESGEGSGEDKAKPKLNREKHEVPEDYQLWLDVILPRWHKKWGGEVKAEDSAADKKKNEFKDSVSHDFRKWVWAYLKRRFGKKEAPKLAEDKSKSQ